MKNKRKSTSKVPDRKPRNPVAPAARMRAAGPHGTGNRRQQAKRRLLDEVQTEIA